MDAYDLVMLTVLAGATAFGAWKGLAWQLASIGSMVVSYIVSVRLREPVSQMIDATPPWNKAIAMLILFVGTSLIIWIAFRFVSESINRFKLKEFDRQVGALFGLAKGVVLCVIITLFAVTVLSVEKRQTVIESRSGYYIAVLLDRAHGLMPEEFHTAVHPYLHTLDPEMRAHSHDGDESAHDELPFGLGQGTNAGPTDPFADSRSSNGGASNPRYDAAYDQLQNPRYDAPPYQPYNPPYAQSPQDAYSQPASPAYSQPYNGPYNPNSNVAPPSNYYAPTPANIPPYAPAPNGRAPAPSGELLNLPALIREVIR